MTRRLLLGITLIALASAGLLLSDTSRRADTGPGRIPRVAILQHASQPIIDEGVRGMLEGLAAAGYADGHTVQVTRYNAENDMATSAAIAAEMTSADYDLLLTATTVSLQAVANANQTRRRPHVFALVTDPAASGVGISAEDPLDHPPYMAGYGTMQPVARAIAIARSMYPRLSVVGIPWNPGETNSKVATALAKEACAQLGIEVLEASVENTAAVAEAAASLVARGAQALWSPGDVTVLTAVESVVAEARKARIPVFTNIPGSAAQGTLFDVGANYLEVGRLAGELAARVLDGVDPATIPVENVVPERVTLNEGALEGLRDPWRIPEEVRRAAEETNRPREARVADAAPAGAAGTRAAARLARPWKIDLLDYVEVQDAEDARRGIHEGFRDAGLVAGRDYVLEERSAQGDMPTLSALVDAALTEGTDLLMTLSTPTLQAALARGRGKPIVFTFCASGVAAGAGRSDDDHLPNVTGVPSASPYAEVLALAREAVPGLRRIGTLTVPSEANSVYNTEKLVELARAEDIEVVQVAVNAIADVPDAASSLVARDLDAVVQVASNLTTSSFASIARAGASARVPVLSTLSGDLDNGAALVVARDYVDAGKRAAALAVRIMRGESPATIPFQPLDTQRLLVNLDAARAQGLRVPPAIVGRAQRVIGAGA